MELIKELARAGKDRMGLFFCPSCKKDVVKEWHHGIRNNTCSLSCSKFSTKEAKAFYKKKKKHENRNKRFVEFLQGKTKNELASMYFDIRDKYEDTYQVLLSYARHRETMCSECVKPNKDWLLARGIVLKRAAKYQVISSLVRNVLGIANISVYKQNVKQMFEDKCYGLGRTQERGRSYNKSLDVA